MGLKSKQTLGLYEQTLRRQQVEGRSNLTQSTIFYFSTDFGKLKNSNVFFNLEVTTIRIKYDITYSTNLGFKYSHLSCLSS